MGIISRLARKVALCIAGVLLCFFIGGCTVALEYSSDVSDDDSEALQYATNLLLSLKAHPNSRDESNIDVKDFDALELGKGIIAYDISTETLIPTGVVVYPVYENRVLVATVQSATSGENRSYILGDEFVDGLGDFLKKNEEAVIFRDSDYVIARSKTNVVMLASYYIAEKPNLRNYLRDIEDITYTETALIGKIDIPTSDK